MQFYYCFGEYDGVAILDAPDDKTAAAVVLMTVTPGRVRSIKTTKLLTPEEMQEAVDAIEKVRAAKRQGQRDAR